MPSVGDMDTTSAGTTAPQPPAPSPPTPQLPAAPVDVLMADGRIARIRVVTAADRVALEGLHEGVSDESMRSRFFAVNRATARKYADHLTEPDQDPQPIALLAEYDGEVVAVASAEQGDLQSAEVAFLVADEAHGLGLATLLLEHLAAAARSLGIRRFTAEVLSANVAMGRVFRDAGFDVQSIVADGVTSLAMETAATDRAVAAADARERVAEARSLRPLLAPQSVAIVGVRRDGTGIGQAVLEDVRSNGFAGDLYVVHPKTPWPDGGEGWTCVPDFAAIGHPVDLVIVAVPAEQVVAVGRAAAEAGTGALVVVSSGLGEMGEEGKRQQHELVDVARAHSMRVVGPNCLGMMVNTDDVQLNATFSRHLPRSGGLAVASQSGGVGIALLDAAKTSGLGLSYFVSLGNKADVSGNDLLAAWQDDDQVHAAALYLESFGNPRKFARVARRFSEHKPLLAVVGGRSDGGRRAGLSHTASAAAPAVGVEALFRHSGVIACRSVDELADTALLIDTQPMPPGPRVAIVSNAGGLGVLAADRASLRGLVVPEFSAELQAAVASCVSGTAAVTNPVDLGAGVAPAGFGQAVADVLTSGEVDAVLVVIAGTGISDTRAACSAAVEARRTTPDLPVLLVTVGEVELSPNASELTSFRTVESAMDALANVATYATWRAAPTGDPRPVVPGVAARARTVISRPTRPGGSLHDGWLAVEDARDLLACFGVEGPTGVVTSAADAEFAASRIGFPVVLKIAEPNVLHKTDRGLIRAGLTSAEAVAEVVQAFAAELGRPEFRVLVQPQVSGGVEVAVGVVSDASFGPLVMVAAGGVATDVWKDRVFLVPPITDVDAARAVRSLRIWPLLAGFRGSPPVDVASLEQVILAVGQLADELPEVAETDLNPVIVTPRGAQIVDVRIRVRTDVAVPDAGIPRRLRSPR